MAIDFEFELSTHLWKGNLDLTQGTYELVEEIDSFHGVVSNAVAYTEQVTITWYSTSGRIARSDILSDDDNVYIFQYPTILGLKRVQGTLYIYE